MAQFDRLLTAMVTNKAESLVLEDGELVKVEVGGQLRALTKSPLTNVQIIALLKEIASPDVQKQLDAGKPATIAYVTNDGAFVVRAMINGTKWHVVAMIDDKAEFKRLTGQFKAMDLPPETPPKGAPVQAAAPAAAPKRPSVATAAPKRPSVATAIPVAPPSVAPAASGNGMSSKSELDLIAPFEGS